MVKRIHLQSIKRGVYFLALVLLMGCRTNNHSKTTLPKTSVDSKIVEKVLPACDSNIVNKAAAEWIFCKVDSSRLLFTNGQAVETHLFELTYIGQIPLEHKAPLLIFSGRECQGCDANVSIYMHSPSDGQLEVEYGKNRFKYPGKESDYETNKVFYTSRAFYGQILNNAKGIIWYEKRLMENGHWDRDVFLSWMDHDIRRDTLYNSSKGLDQTLALLRKGLCKEIVGRQYKSEP